MSSEPPIPSPIESMVASTSADLGRLLTELADRLSQHHAGLREEALATVRREAEEALRAVREESERTLERVLAEADAQAGARLAEATREHERAVQQQLESEASRLREGFDEQLRLAQAGFDEALSTARVDTERAVGDAEARLREQHDADLARLRAEHDAETASVRADSESRFTAALAASSSAAAAARLDDRAGEREQRLAVVERLLRAVERLDQATSLRAALDTLAEGAAAEAPRSVLFVVRAGALRGWCASGVAAAPEDVLSFRLALESAGPLGTAVTAGTPMEVHASRLSAETAGALEFLALPEDRAGLAVPVVVDGTTVAVLYADDGGVAEREVPASWPEATQVLARHTARCLESITARRAAAARQPDALPFTPRRVEPPKPDPPLPQATDAESARRFARLVVSELKLYNEALVAAGRRARDLRARLAEPIARARRQYDLRVPASLPGRDDYFEQELVRTLAEGDPDLLGGRDLATA
jgi:hypothetical protein